MHLLTRYLLRQLVAPFIFALAALTSIMLLNQVAKKFGSLVGKGLDWSIIGEVFALSVPFIVAMTLPMAVLVAVLYAFSHLASDNEITAMRASGVSVLQILRPILVWGIVMAGVNLAFVDQVLPRSNARLRTLLIDIGRKRPTFELREQVINEIPPSRYFLRASRIDPATGWLRGVTIYDLGGATSRRVIYADSGLMGYAEGQTDLSLRLYDGKVHQYKPGEPQGFELTYFEVNDIRVKNVFDELKRNTSEQVRGDREMSTCEMLSVVGDADTEVARARQTRTELLVGDLRALLGLPALPRWDPVEDPGPLAYCGWAQQIRHVVLPKTVEARSPAQEPAFPAPWKLPVPGMPPEVTETTDSSAVSAVRLSNWSDVAGAVDQFRDADRRADRYMVEVHKKWAISTACITFVVIGIVLALRFPRGGMGLVIGGALAVFAVHYVGLTAGESLADRGRISPAVAMWAPNVILTALGLLGLARVSRESGSTRGGDWQDLIESLKAVVRRRRRRRA